MKEKKSFIKKLGSFFSVLLLLVLVPYLILSVFLTYSKVTKMNEVAGIFGFKPVVVRNNEMAKTLKKGDLVIVKDILNEADSISSGDIVAFRLDNDKKVTIRRIISIVRQPEFGEDNALSTDGEYRVKADNKDKNDRKRISTSDIVGKSILVIPTVGTYFSYIENTWLLVISVPILITIIILLFIIMNKCAAKKIKENKENSTAQESQLFSAAELSSGVQIRENLLNSKLKSRSVSESPQQSVTPSQPTPQPQVQQSETPKGEDIGGGIYIVPPTEVQNNQDAPQVVHTPTPQVQPTVQPQVQQSQPVVTPLPQNNSQNGVPTIVVPQNNNQK